MPDPPAAENVSARADVAPATPAPATPGLATPSPASAIERAVQQGLESERRPPVSSAELERRTRELRYREALDQRLLRLGVGAIVFVLSAAWLSADVILTLASGWGELGGRPFRLEGSVMVAFLTTSTATVIGLFLVFLRWLYPQAEREDRGRDREGDREP